MSKEPRFTWEYRVVKIDDDYFIREVYCDRGKPHQPLAQFLNLPCSIGPEPTIQGLKDLIKTVSRSFDFEVVETKE